MASVDKSIFVTLVNRRVEKNLAQTQDHYGVYPDENKRHGL
jgi:hypothetical protein